jgi:hypothetical protein
VGYLVSNLWPTIGAFAVVLLVNFCIPICGRLDHALVSAIISALAWGAWGLGHAKAHEFDKPGPNRRAVVRHSFTWREWIESQTVADANWS